jgi:hypothetical protein
MRGGMRHRRRKVTPGVSGGKVRKKHRWKLTPPDNYAQTSGLEIIRRSPGPNSIHVVDERDILRFIALIHDWPDISSGLRSIVLEPFEETRNGLSRPDGVITLTAWPKDLVEDFTTEWYLEHADVFSRIGVPCEPITDDDDDEPGVRCWFDRSTARAFMLLHVFLHELGHHVDRSSSRGGGDCPRGEDFAESWAIERERQLWPLYKEHFGRPGMRW